MVVEINEYEKFTDAGFRSSGRAGIEHFPEFAPYLKWHLCTSEGPLHYIENTLYWLGYHGYCDGGSGNPPQLDYARSTALWPELSEADFCPLPFVGRVPKTGEPPTANEVRLRQQLAARLPQLLVDFHQAMIELKLLEVGDTL